MTWLWSFWQPVRRWVEGMCATSRLRSYFSIKEPERDRQTDRDRDRDRECVSPFLPSVGHMPHWWEDHSIGTILRSARQNHCAGDSQWLGARQASGQWQQMPSHTKRPEGPVALQKILFPAQPTTPQQRPEGIQGTLHWSRTVSIVNTKILPWRRRRRYTIMKAIVLIQKETL